MFQGMDTDQVLSESEALERAAQRLEGVMDGLHSSVSGVEWIGPDADAFREQWGAVRRQGEGIVVPGLGERSRELQRHAEEQEQASSVEGEGWFLNFHTFTNYVKEAFFRGTSLRPVPPGESKHKEVRYLDIREDDQLDEAQMAMWIRQAAALPGWVP